MKTMTAAEFKAIRAKLGCTGEAFAIALGFEAAKASSLQNITYLFESGRRPVPETVARLAIMLGRYGIPDGRWFAGDTLARLVAMFRHYGVPTERLSKDERSGGGDVHASR